MGLFSSLSRCNLLWQARLQYSKDVVQAVAAWDEKAIRLPCQLGLAMTGVLLVVGKSLIGGTDFAGWVLAVDIRVLGGVGGASSSPEVRQRT